MILAFDFGGTQIKSGLVDEDFSLLETFEALPSPDNLEDLLAILDSCIRPLLGKISGLAISCPGKVDTTTGTVYEGGVLRYLDGFEARAILSEKYQLEVAVLNDGKAAALAELATGNLQGIQQGLALVLGTGLGGGLIINGQLYQGANFQAGELTFMFPPQLEHLSLGDFAGKHVSAVAMIEDCAKVLGLPNLKDGLAVFDALKAGNGQVYPIFENYCRYLAIYIHNLQAVLDVERVVLGGGISSQPLLIQELKKQQKLLAQEHDLISIVATPDIKPCKHRNGANLIGAAYFLRQG